MTEPERYNEMLRRISHLEHQHEEFSLRLRTVETWQVRTTEILTSIKGDLGEIKADGVWLRRIMIGALIAAVMSFIIGGGLVGIVP